jgi:23S rRNA (uracil1939-C5)-methyltransferase
MDEHYVVKSLDLEGQGVAQRSDGKVVFIDGALPFEVVSARVHQSKGSFDKGTVVAILRESSQRVQPGCPHFGLHEGACGGCKLQHLHPSAQIAIKQRVLEENLWRLGRVKAEIILRPIEGPHWGYRHRARLSVRYVRKKGAVLIGFHERKSHFVADMRQCAVLAPQISALLLPLRALIASLDAAQECPQIELAMGDAGAADGVQGRQPPSAGPTIALVLRHLVALTSADRLRLEDFALSHPGVQWWLQAKGPESVCLLTEPGKSQVAVLRYCLPEFGVNMPFRPTDFTQVNPHINRVLVSLAVRLLALAPDERVIDWFCGLGNFTLPIMTQAAQVLGVEGNAALVERARENSAIFPSPKNSRRRLGGAEFLCRNLFEIDAQMLRSFGNAHKWLIDPPRDGAYALVKALASLNGDAVQDGDWTPPHQIVYVSCNPATLARDAGVLVGEAGYRCSAAGVINMFTHTAHIESIAVFVKAP